MDFSLYVTRTVEQVLALCNVSMQTGLSTPAVQNLQQQHGFNVFASRDIGWWRVLLRQMTSPFFYLLVGAAILSCVLGEFLSGGMIIIFIVINLLLGFYQEFHAESTLKLLKKLIMPHATVKRDGVIVVVATRELVPGDIILLEPGDIIPADVRFIDGKGITVDESILTGESAPVVKQIDPQPMPSNSLQASNLGFNGTVMTSGKAVALVVATGNSTIFGSLVHVTLQTNRDSLIARDIRKFGVCAVIVMAVTLGLIFCAHVFLRGPTVSTAELLLFIIALAVSIVPEALPVVMSFCLSRGALYLAQRHVIVRRLSAVEDLGSIEVLCVDKTGTITENKMELVDIFGDRNQVLNYALFANSPVDDASKSAQHSFDGAVAQALQKEALSVPEFTIEHALPYDQDQWATHTFIRLKNQHELVVRGAFEKVLIRCLHNNEETNTAAQEWVKAQGLQGRRILALAQRSYTQVLCAEELTSQHDLTLVGMLAFEDPIKPTVLPALEKARKLGITVKMMSGDAPEVTGAVAVQVGLTSKPENVVVGQALEQLDEAEKEHVINQASVFARISPLQKLDIVKILQKRYCVGFLGEGVNDAPALKLAHVALVVENGADIAKDAADIILLKKSLSAIIDGIEEGRKIFANTLKYLNVSLASNFSNFCTLACISLVIDFLPMLPLQILFLNLLSDFPMIAIASDYVEQIDLKKPQAFNFAGLLKKALIFGIICSAFDGLFFFIFFSKKPIHVQTAWFIFSLCAELMFFFSIRTKKFILQAHRASTTVIIFSVISAAIVVATVMNPLGRDIFHFEMLAYNDVFKIISMLVGLLIALEITKWFYNYYAAKR